MVTLEKIMDTAQQMKLSIKGFFSKRDQIRRKLLSQFWSHLLKKYLMENFNFCAVGNKYLTLVPANERKGEIKKYEELWINKIRALVRPVTKKSDDYDEQYIKIKFDSDDELPLNKTIEIPTLSIVVRAIFHENNNYY